MGKVRISETWDWREFQETYEFIYEYVYCDQCGSFDIGYPSPVLELAVFSLILCFALAVLGYLVTSSWLTGTLVFVVAFVVCAICLAMNSTACRKCGNTQFTSGNVLNYRENDGNILDVPRESARRRYVETNLIWEG